MSCIHKINYAYCICGNEQAHYHRRTVSFRLKYTTYQKQDGFVSLLTYIRNINSVIALLNVKQSLVVIACSYQVFTFSVFYRTHFTSDFYT